MSRAHYLWEKLGPLVQSGLLDDSVFEIALNPDGKLWFAKKTTGYECVGDVSLSEVNAFVYALAEQEQRFLNEETPYLDATLPFRGERINVTIPPITDHVSFNIRKKSPVVLTLNDYVNAKVLTTDQMESLKNAIARRQNILISGSPAAGKTTLANALLAEFSHQLSQGHRILLLEQVPELICALPNQKRLLTSPIISMRQLLWIAMRNAPDCIAVGEVRDGAALDLLKAWNTGCPGGVATIHANSAHAAKQRILDLASEVTQNPPRQLLQEAVDVIVHIETDIHHPAKRRVTEILFLKDEKS